MLTAGSLVSPAFLHSKVVKLEFPLIVTCCVISTVQLALGLPWKPTVVFGR